MTGAKIFVFGSNLAGRHGAGAALYAKQHHGAVQGLGWGRCGNSYALPTKDYELRPLSFDRIEYYVGNFLVYARANPQMVFEVTAVGCGLAGYTPALIAPMFVDAPENCELPSVFLSVLEGLKA